MAVTKDSPAIVVRRISPRSPGARLLIEALDQYQAGLYPPESNHLDPIDELERDHVRFFGAFAGDQLLGCGAVKVMDDGYGEIKRMYVLASGRGKGIGRRLLQRLERYLIEQGIHCSRLETGVRQPEALALYRSCGYVEVGPFASYGPDPLSVFMEKRLDR